MPSGQTTEDNNGTQAAKPASGELVQQRPIGSVAKPNASAIEGFAALGVDVRAIQINEVQSGGVAKWLDLSAFQEDAHAPQNKPVKGNGKFFQGLLIGRNEMPAKDGQGELNEDGEPVRHYYTIRLASPCPVQYKNEEGQTINAIAEAGEVINIGERHQLRVLRPWTEDGGMYGVIIQPHSRVKIGGGHTMWTFRVQQIVLRQPVKAIIQKAPAPF